MAEYEFDPAKQPGTATNIGTLVNEGQTWCIMCNRDVGPDVSTHFADVHTTLATKQRTPIASWQERTKEAQKTLRAVLNSEDAKEQMKQIDDVILALYQIRIQIAGNLKDLK